MKIRAVQSLTNMHKVTPNAIENSFEECGLLSSQSHASISVLDCELLLCKLFGKVKNCCDKELSAELTLNFVVKCYDSGRTGQLKVCALKTCLLILCCTTPQEKYTCLFKLFCSADFELTPANLHMLLGNVLILTESVFEEEVFSVDKIPATVESCLQMISDQKNVVDEPTFLQWMNKEPQMLVWITTLHRIVTAEAVKHEAKCVACKVYPIVGLRYRCLKCFNTDICQNCFLTRKGTRDHKSTHPTREYCMTTTSGDDVKDFGRQLRNKITRKYRHQTQKKAYLPYSELQPEKRFSGGSDHLHGKVNRLASRLKDLEEDRNSSLESNNRLENQECYEVQAKFFPECQNTDSVAVSLSKHSLSTEFLDKGVSVSTLDDIAFGKEDELLKGMTETILAATNENTGNTNKRLLELTSEVDVTLSSFLAKVDKCSTIV